MRARSVLVLGGARSGKTAYALKLAEAASASRVYLAAAEAGDAEMAARIARHRAERGAGWTTREAPLDLAAALTDEARAGRVVLADCLTLWLSNWMLAARDPADAVAAMSRALAAPQGPVILVSNEVGSGIVPPTRLGRDFRDWQGRLNQEAARACDAVALVTAGLPRLIKPATPPALELS